MVCIFSSLGGEAVFNVAASEFPDFSNRGEGLVLVAPRFSSETCVNLNPVLDSLGLLAPERLVEGSSRFALATDLQRLVHRRCVLPCLTVAGQWQDPRSCSC